MLKGKTVWVTGASGGIGGAVAKRFASAGANLILAGRDRVRLEALASICERESGVTPEVLIYDLCKAVEVAAGFQRVVKLGKRLDVLVNNAGIMLDAPIGMIGRDAIDHSLQVNVVGTLVHMQYAAKLMSRFGSGSIINVASIIGLAGNTNQMLYAASKSAVIGATKAAAKELAPKGIRVNALAPGYIDTPMTENYSDAIKSAALQRIGMGRIGSGDDVASAALFFASDLSIYVTGQILGVDGGMVI